MKTIGERLVFARESKGEIWTQRHLALVSGVSVGTIGMLEIGKRGNTGTIPGTIPQIAKALGVRFEWLAYGTGDMLAEPELNGKLSALALMDAQIQLQVAQLAILLNSVTPEQRTMAYTAASQALIGFLPGANPTAQPALPAPVKKPLA